MTEPVSFGQIVAGTHILPMRVYWEDTDASGIVFYANYLRFVERGRSDLLRLLGVNQQKLLQEGGAALTVRRCQIDYRRPARLDDQLEVRSTISALRGASLTARQEVWRGDLDLVAVDVEIACIDLSGRPRRLPALVREVLAPLVPPTSVSPFLAEDSHG